MILLVVDVTVGVTDDDLAAARIVRRAAAPVLLVANKVDDGGRELATWEFVSLGLGDPWPVSALHGRGTGDLLDEVVRRLPGQDPVPWSGVDARDDVEDTDEDPGARRARGWPSSGGPTWASPRSSTG